MVGATLTCRTTTGRVLTIDSIPKKQARKVYAYAQQIEEQAYEKRQQVELEKIRAGAGGVVIHSPAQTSAPAMPPPLPVQEAQKSADAPLEALATLKKLLQAELITDEEFGAKKAEILARL